MLLLMMMIWREVTFNSKIGFKFLIIFPSCDKGVEELSIAAVGYVTSKGGTDFWVCVFKLQTNFTSIK